MLSYILRRIGLALLITVLAVTTLFVIIHAIPGDPVSTMLGPRASEDMRAALEQRMGLDRPLPVQIALFFGNMLRGDLGTDVFSNRAVTEIVLGQIPYTLVLILASIAWSAVLGIALGCYSAVRRNSLGDRLTGILSVSVIAVPAFVISLYSLLIFSVRLQWFPAIGAGDSGDILDQFVLDRVNGRTAQLILHGLVGDEGDDALVEETRVVESRGGPGLEGVDDPVVDGEGDPHDDARLGRGARRLDANGDRPLRRGNGGEGGDALAPAGLGPPGSPVRPANGLCGRGFRCWAA